MWLLVFLGVYDGGGIGFLLKWKGCGCWIYVLDWWFYLWYWVFYFVGYLLFWWEVFFGGWFFERLCLVSFGERKIFWELYFGMVKVGLVDLFLFSYMILWVWCVVD